MVQSGTHYIRNWKYLDGFYVVVPKTTTKIKRNCVPSYRLCKAVRDRYTYTHRKQLFMPTERNNLDSCCAIFSMSWSKQVYTKMFSFLFNLEIYCDVALYRHKSRFFCCFWNRNRDGQNMRIADFCARSQKCVHLRRSTQRGKDNKSIIKSNTINVNSKNQFTQLCFAYRPKFKFKLSNRCCSC